MISERKLFFLAFNIFVELVSPEGWSMSCVSSILPQRRRSVSGAAALSGLQRAVASDFKGGAPFLVLGIKGIKKGIEQLWMLCKSLNV
jgi:hypothetical protein